MRYFAAQLFEGNFIETVLGAVILGLAVTHTKHDLQGEQELMSGRHESYMKTKHRRREELDKLVSDPDRKDSKGEYVIRTPDEKERSRTAESEKNEAAPASESVSVPLDFASYDELVLVHDIQEPKYSHYNGCLAMRLSCRPKNDENEQ